jgi:hypothetical protein
MTIETAPSTHDLARIAPPVDAGAAARTDRWAHPTRLLPATTALGLYTVAVLGLARGVLTSLNTTMIGPLDGDNFLYAWFIWNFRQRLLSGQDPAYSHMIRALTAPVPTFTDGLFNHLLAVPLQSFLSTLGAYDVTVLLSYALSGLTMYLLASAFTRNWFACFIAGLVFTFSTYHFARGDMHLGLLTLELLPLCAWRLVLFVRDPGWKNAVLAGIASGLVPWADVYYFAYFLVPFGLAVVIAVAVSNPRWFTRPANLIRGAVVLALAAVVTLPAIYPDIFLAPDVSASVAALAVSNTKIALSADLSGFFLPDPYNPLMGWRVARFFANQAVFPARSVFLGFPALGLAALVFFFRSGRTRVALAWLLLTVAGVAVALGPVLQIAGKKLFPLPFYGLLFDLPFLDNFRAPAVLSVIALVGISVLAALGATALLDSIARGRQERIVLGVALVLLVALGLAPSAVSGYRIASFQVPTPTVYQQIAASPDDGLLLDVPTQIASVMFFQSIHHKPLVGGILPREPARSLTAIDEVPYVWLMNSWWPVPTTDTGPVSYPPADIFTLPRFVEGLRAHGISWVVLHRYYCADPAVNSAYYCPAVPHYDEIRSFLQYSLGTPFFDSTAQNTVAWHVADAPAPPPTDPRVALGSGWIYGIWLPQGAEARRLVDGSLAHLDVDALTTETAHLRVRAASVTRPLTMEVRLDGRLLATETLPVEQPTELDLGTIPLSAGHHVLDLQTPARCTVPDPANSTMCVTFAVQRVDLTRT